MTRSNTTQVRPGIYRHYKDKFYEVIDCARHTETGEEFVVYRTLYGDYDLWIRPLIMFVEEVEVDGRLMPRFELVRPFGEVHDFAHIR